MTHQPPATQDAIIASLEAQIAAIAPQPTIPALLNAVHETLSQLTFQLSNLSQAILAPTPAPLPESPPRTLITPGASPTSPSHITDHQQNTWTIQFARSAQIPTLCLNGHPDPFTAPCTCAYYGPGPNGPVVSFQRITGQWYQWLANYWQPTTNPQTPASPDWGPPALRATEATPNLFHRPDLPVNLDLLTSLFTDSSPAAATFLPSPIPLVTRPRGINRPPIYQRSDNTFLIPLAGYSTPITLQFPGLRPTFIRLWDATSPHEPVPRPIRTATGTDTISVPLTRDSIVIIEMALG